MTEHFQEQYKRELVTLCQFLAVMIALGSIAYALLGL